MASTEEDQDKDCEEDIFSFTHEIDPSASLNLLKMPQFRLGLKMEQGEQDQNDSSETEEGDNEEGGEEDEHHDLLHRRGKNLEGCVNDMCHM